MRVINTCARIREFFAGERFDMQAWERYAAEISPELVEKCISDAEAYDFDREVLPVVQAALQGDGIERTDASFRAVMQEMSGRLSLLFDDDPEIDVLIYLGLCNGAGWATTLDGRRAVLLGVEKIIELGWDGVSDMRGLVLHEIGHIWHEQARPRTIDAEIQQCPAVMQLYCEGIAMRCEQLLCGDDSFWHQDRDGWLQWCAGNEAAAKREYLSRWLSGESTQDFFGDWNAWKGHSDVGYYLGCRFVQHMQRRRSLRQIAALSEADVCAELRQYLQSE